MVACNLLVSNPLNQCHPFKDNKPTYHMHMCTIMTQRIFEPNNNSTYFHKKNGFIFFKNRSCERIRSNCDKRVAEIKYQCTERQKESILVLSHLDQFCSFLPLKETHTPTKLSRYHLKRSRLFSTECCPLSESDKTGSCACHTQIFGPRRIWKLQCERDFSMQCLCRHSGEAQVFPYERGDGVADFQ